MVGEAQQQRIIARVVIVVIDSETTGCEFAIPDFLSGEESSLYWPGFDVGWSFSNEEESLFV